MPPIMSVLWMHSNHSINNNLLSTYYVLSTVISVGNSSVNREIKIMVLAQIPPQKAWDKGLNTGSLIWEMNPSNWYRELEEQHRGGKGNLKLHHWTDYLGEKLEHKPAVDLGKSHVWAPQNCPPEAEKNNSYPQLLWVISWKFNLFFMGQLAEQIPMSIPLRISRENPGPKARALECSWGKMQSYYTYMNSSLHEQQWLEGKQASKLQEVRCTSCLIQSLPLSSFYSS